jgi:hypothetical protein
MTVRLRGKLLKSQSRNLLNWGFAGRLFKALRAELSFEGHLIFEISQSEISKMRCPSRKYSAAEGGKRLFTALRAELSFERHVIFTISLREIVKMTCVSR